MNNLHGFNPVAPLKRFTTLTAAMALVKSPRVQPRGPIEARCLPRAIPPGGLYLHGFNPVAPLKQWYRVRFQPKEGDLHGFNPVAPLKLRSSFLGPFDLSESPRVQPRGPIEAIDLVSVDKALSADLHGFNPVAPLKQTKLSLRWHKSDSSPRVQPRGPIEASRWRER